MFPDSYRLALLPNDAIQALTRVRVKNKIVQTCIGITHTHQVSKLTFGLGNWNGLTVCNYGRTPLEFVNQFPDLRCQTSVSSFCLTRRDLEC